MITFTESVSENVYYSKLFHKIAHYYTKLQFIINDKICDESTLYGVFNYDQEFIDKFNECEKLQDIKVFKNLCLLLQII
jgi:hypothetical protein